MRGATLAGTVVDPDDRAVAGAVVLVTARGALVSRVTTDDTGAFAIDRLAPDRYELHVVRDGFRAQPIAADLREGERRTVTLRLQVSAFAEQVVVSASEVAQPRSRTPASVTVISGDEVRAYQHPTIASALRGVPGVSLARSGGDGAVTGLFSRGGESDFTTVVVDGVPVNAFGGGFDFGQLTAGDLERIEVVRGPQSAQWGGGAIGGVIQIITAPDARQLLEASAEGGTRRSTRAAARAAVPAGRWRLFAGGERAASNGFTGTTGRGEGVTNDDWRSTHVTTGARHDGPTRLEITARFERSERGFPGPFGSDPGGTFEGIDRVSRGENRAVLAGGGVSRAFGRVRPGARLSWFRTDGDFLGPFGASESGSRRLTGRADADVRISRGADATAGIEFLREQGTSTYITGTTGDEMPVRRGVLAVFGEVRYDAGRLFAAAGLRAERIRRERLEADPNPFAPRPELPADETTAVTPRVSASWFLRTANARGEWTRVRASAGLGIRSPDAFELAFTDNPHLKPERTRSVEAGLEHALAGGLVVAEATAFANRYDDLIVAIGRSLSDASRYRSDNVSNARSRGIEALVRARSRAGLSAGAALTFLHTEVLAVDRLAIGPPPFRPGDRLLRRPRVQGWIETAWRAANVNAFVTAGARGRTLDVDPTLGAFGGLFMNPGYASVDAGGGWRVARALEIFGRVTNLFDRRYEEALGFPSPGRRVYAGLRVRVR